MQNPTAWLSNKVVYKLQVSDLNIVNYIWNKTFQVMQNPTAGLSNKVVYKLNVSDVNIVNCI